MTMHLVRGMTTISTKKRKGKKLDLDKLDLQRRRYNKDMRRKNMHSCQFDTLQDYVDYVQGNKKPIKKEFKTYAPPESYVRNTKKYPSLETSGSIPDSGRKKEPQKYTGDLIIGIGTMHKSNMVPIMRGTNEAKDIAAMRR